MKKMEKMESPLPVVDDSILQHVQGGLDTAQKIGIGIAGGAAGAYAIGGATVVIKAYRRIPKGNLIHPIKD